MAASALASHRRQSSTPAGGIQVELAVSCRNLRNRDHFSRSDPVCLLYTKSRGSRTWKLLGKTELLKNTNDPEWAKTFLVDYYFEEKQQLRFAVYDWDEKTSEATTDQDDLGTVECTLAELVRAPSSKFEKPLSPFRHEPGDCGHIVVYVEEKAGLKDKITFELTGSNLDKKDVFSESDPYFTISRVNPDGSDTLVYRSEYIKNNANPEWNVVEISSGKLCNGDWSRKLRFEVWDHDSGENHDFIGDYETTLDEMSAGEGFQILQWDVVNKKEKAHKRHYVNSGTVILKSIKIDQDTTFLDFVRGGLRLHFVVAVDFTLSGGHPENTESLHYCDRERPENPYTMAIKAIGDIFQDYDYDAYNDLRMVEQEAIAERFAQDRQFVALGFGGLVHGRTSHCFPLNGNPRNPYCKGIEGVVQAYYQSLDTVPLSDPTCYAPVIDYVRSMAENMVDTGNDYYVLLLLTDGGISDMEETKRLLVENSHLPMSIILVGVGRGDMSKMDILDDDQRTMSYMGRKAERDIVQFVEMSKYLPDGCLDPITFHSVMDAANGKYHLAKDVLNEIPAQVVQYMQRNDIKPRVVADVEAATSNLQKFNFNDGL